MVRFLHTGDLQLGMSRRFLAPEAQARFAQARLDTLASLGALARSSGAEFVVVAGDVFDSNFVNRQVVGRALEAMASIRVPVFLLPGNHDPLDASSVYRAEPFASRCPANVRVLTDPTPIEVRPGVEVVGAPWATKRPLADLAERACLGLSPDSGIERVLVAHGAVDAVCLARSEGRSGPGERREPSMIHLAALESALDSGRISYVALGDRHSTTSVGQSGRVWYAGAPEPTDFDETDPGEVLLVTLDRGTATVERHYVAAWRFVRLDERVAGPDDIAAVASTLDALDAKATTIVRLGLVGTLALRDRARLDAALDDRAELFAALHVWDAASDLVVIPDRLDNDELGLSGFAADAFGQLERIAVGGAGSGAGAGRGSAAIEALRLLYRLSQLAD